MLSRLSASRCLQTFGARHPSQWGGRGNRFAKGGGRLHSAHSGMEITGGRALWTTETQRTVISRTTNPSPHLSVDPREWQEDCDGKS